MRASSTVAVFASILGLLVMSSGGFAPGGGRGDPIAPARLGRAPSPPPNPSPARLALMAARMNRPGFEMDVDATDGARRFRAAADHATYFADAEGLTAVARRGDGLASAWKMRFVGGVAGLTTGEERLPGLRHRFLGNDRSRWRTGLERWARLRLVDAWGGIDVVLGFDAGRLRYDFEVAPGADPSRIALEFEGVDGLRVRGDGSLAFEDDGLEVVHGAPTLLQRTGAGTCEVAGRWALASERVVRLAIGPFDPAVALLVDPVVDYATWLGGGEDDRVHGVAVDAEGAVHLCGATWSADFPPKGGLAAPFHGGSFDMFVTRLLPDGSGISWSALVGGSGSETAAGIAFDPEGNAIVGGDTNSTDFPMVDANGPTGGPWNLAPDGGPNAALFRASPGGSRLLYSSYRSLAAPTAITSVLCAGSRVVLGGWLEATWLEGSPLPPPTTDPRVGKGGRDCWVLVLRSDGLGQGWSVLLGGTGDEGTETALAVGPDGAVYVAGTTSSIDLPTTALALATSPPGGGADGFLARLASDGSSVEWLSYVGGSGGDRPQSLALAPDGALWIGGATTSADLPLATPFQAAPSALFLQRVDPLLPEEVDPQRELDDQIADQLRGGSYLGPPAGPASLQGLVIDRGGRAHLFGHCAAGLPVTADAWQSSFGGGATDLFLATVAPEAAVVEFATYVGGAGPEEAEPGSDLLAMDALGNLHFAATAGPGSSIPATGGTFRISPAGAADLFVGRAFPETGTGVAVLELFTLRGEIRDAALPGRDRLEAAVEMGTRGAPSREVFSPRTDAFGMTWSFDGDAAIQVAIPAGDPGWRSRGSGATLRWQSPRGTEPRVSVALDLRRGILTTKITGATFAAPAALPVATDLELGDLSGGYDLAWREKRPGVLAIGP